MCLANISPDLWDKSGKLKLTKQPGDSTPKNERKGGKIITMPPIDAGSTALLFVW